MPTFCRQPPIALTRCNRAATMTTSPCRKSAIRTHLLPIIIIIITIRQRPRLAVDWHTHIPYITCSRVDHRAAQWPSANETFPTSMASVFPLMVAMVRVSTSNWKSIPQCRFAIKAMWTLSWGTSPRRHAKASRRSTRLSCTVRVSSSSSSICTRNSRRRKRSFRRSWKSRWAAAILHCGRGVTNAIISFSLLSFQPAKEPWGKAGPGGKPWRSPKEVGNTFMKSLVRPFEATMR